MGLGNIWRNLKSRGLKDVTNLQTVGSFLEWKDIEAHGLTIPAEEIIAFSEQIAVRAALCKPCVDNGECIHCHCEIVGKISTPSASCSMDKWGPTLPKEEWDRKKKNDNTKILVL